MAVQLEDRVGEFAPSVPPPLGPMSFQEFLDWDGENQHVEWVNGEMVLMAAVKSLHAEMTGFLYRLLSDYVEDNELGRLYQDPFQMYLPGVSSRAPDLLYASNATLARLQPNHLHGPADLVVEVVSQGYRHVDRRDKFKEYQKGGVPEYWIVDPYRQEASFYVLNTKGLFHEPGWDESGFLNSRALPGFRLLVSALWQDPLPTVKSCRRDWGLQ